MFLADTPSKRTVHGLLRHRADTEPDREFLVFGEERYTYGDLHRLSRRAAAGLSGLGVAKGDSVAILMGNRPEYLALWFGASMLGAVEVPVNTAHRGDLLVHMLSLSGSRVVVTDREYLPALTDVAARLPDLATIVVAGEPVPVEGKQVLALSDLLANDGAVPDIPVTWADPYAIMFTSGTTGPSKGAVMPQNYALRMGEYIAQATGYGREDCLYNALPLFHGNAQVLSTMPALLSGARMVLAERFSASRFWDDVRRHGCTEFNYIGTILSVLMKAEESPADRDHPLRLMMGAGAGPGLFEAFEKRFGVTLIEGYGMSEIGLPFISTWDKRKPGTCGVLNPQYSVRLVGADGQDVDEPDTPGELLIRPKEPYCMMLEYRGMPEKTVEAWQDLWFRTGDFLSRDEDGFWRFVDRKKDALRRRGENISSFEVERAILSHPAVAECAVIPIPSDLGEDDVMACVVTVAGETLTPETLIAHCEREMAAFMVPRYLRFMEALPKTPTARVEKYRLKADGVTAETWDRDTAKTEAVP